MVNRVLRRKPPLQPQRSNLGFKARHELPSTGFRVSVGIMVEIVRVAQINAAKHDAAVVHARGQTHGSNHRATVLEMPSNVVPGLEDPPPAQVAHSRNEFLLTSREPAGGVADIQVGTEAFWNLENQLPRVQGPQFTDDLGDVMVIGGPTLQ